MPDSTPLEPPPEHLKWMLENLVYDSVHGGIHHKNSTKLLGWNSQGYRRWGFQGLRYAIHHIVWLLNTGEWPSHPLDHKDRDKANNHFGNLRYATPEINGRNSKLSKANKTGVKGVFRVKENTYRASIVHHGKPIHIGTFTTVEAAAKARKDAENKYWNS